MVVGVFAMFSETAARVMRPVEIQCFVDAVEFICIVGLVFFVQVFLSCCRTRRGPPPSRRAGVSRCTAPPFPTNEWEQVSVHSGVDLLFRLRGVRPALNVERQSIGLLVAPDMADTLRSTYYCSCTNQTIKSL